MPKDLEGEEKRGRLTEGRGSIQAVLNNQLVCEKIASFLCLSDMKAASQVNRQFLQAMRRTQRFVQEAVLVITDKNAAQSTLQKMEYSWRGVRIDVTDSSDILDDIPRVLKSAEFVCLGAPPGKINEANRAKDSTAARLLTTVLNSTPALSHLQIRTDFLLLDLRTVLSSPAVQETLKNLNQLRILHETEYEGQARFLKNEDADKQKNQFERNIRLLTGLPNRLKTFDLPKLFPATWMKDSADQSVLRLLRNNTTTMEELSILGRVWRLQELGTLTFPVLKTLSAIVDKTAEDRTLAKFLENQRSLEELTVKLDFHEPLMTSIRGRCLELRKLDVTTEFFGGDVEGWRFLGSMKRLKEFRFKILEIATLRNGWRLLAFLPKNQLERLSLEGISTECSGFWNAGGEEELEFGVKTRLLQGFRCLRTLSFLGSRDAVDDELMQWLLTEFVSLEELELSDCDDLSNAGLSGDTSEEWGRNASLSDLRCLQTLKIVRCGGVTPTGVLASCVQLPFLRSLEYSPPYKVREVVVLELARQNPRLEKLTVHFRGDLAILQAKVTEANPRVELVATAPRG